MNNTLISRGNLWLSMMHDESIILIAFDMLVSLSILQIGEFVLVKQLQQTPLYPPTLLDPLQAPLDSTQYHSGYKKGIKTFSSGT